MTPRTNLKIATILVVLSTCFSVTTADAQIWKRLKKKAKEKLKKTEDKLVDKLDKKTDKVLDSTIDGTGKKTKKMENDRSKSYGSASISHSTKYESVQVAQLTKTKVVKKGTAFRLTGSWVTAAGGDGFDGYYLDLKTTNLDELKTSKTFKVPSEATLKIAYDPISKESHKRESSGEFQTYDLKSGAVTVTFNKDENVSISFNGKAILKSDGKYNQNTDDYEFTKIPVNVSGMINTTSPDYRITKEIKEKEKKESTKEVTETEKNALLKELSPTVNIPNSFSFNKNIEVEITDNRGEKYSVNFLIGEYPDIYGMSVAPKEMQGQGEVTMVMTPKTSTMFMNVAGMKMKKSTSINQLGDQYKMSDKLPDGADFAYVKTGNTKIIAGYNCEEYKVEYNYTNSQGSASFWVSKDFPIQNMELPMLGMKLNNPYLSGFVLELNSDHQSQKMTMQVTKITNQSLTINSSDYKKAGF